MVGIEPTIIVLKTTVLPLNYTFYKYYLTVMLLNLN